jgi:DtxR family transcriptional regulator, Mn-dependent transcriptional regulator
MVQPASVPISTRPTPTIEDYLAVIYVMDRDGEDIIAARLAESLEVTPPTVTMTLKRMERDGWISIEGHKNIHLTATGLTAAQSVIQRHMLVEWMLARMLKVPWSRIHSEAHQIEHTISAEIEASMRASLDNPQLCPHGNPLPGYEYVTESWIPLTEIAAGEYATIRRVHEIAEDNPELMGYLETNGITPGARVEIAEILPFNQTLRLKLGKTSVTLGFPAAQYILVEKEKAV